MSIDWATIRDWDAAALDDAAQQVQRRVNELSALADDLNWTHTRRAGTATRQTWPAPSGSGWSASTTSSTTRPTR